MRRVSMVVIVVMVAGWAGAVVPVPVSAVASAGGTVVGWGDNIYGSYGGAAVPAGLSGVTAISAGNHYSLALKSDGTVVAWGGYTRMNPAGLSGVTAISAGYEHMLALKSDGTVVASGNDDSGQVTVPAGLSGVTAISAGRAHSLALKSDGTVVAWGSDHYGQVTVPAGLSGVTAISAGGLFSLALKSNGTVVAWGYNGDGQVPAGLSGVTAISAGYEHSLALKSDGTVVAWGYNGDGEATVPAGLSGVTAISAGAFHSLALKGDGTVVAWGSNGEGEATVPAGLSGVTAISGGDFLSLALTERTVVNGCTTVTPGPGGQVAYRLTVNRFPANASLSGFIINYADDGTTTVHNGLPISTGPTGTGTSQSFPGNVTHSTYRLRSAIFRDTNRNGRWDPGADQTLFQGTTTLAANACQNVTYAPK